MSEDDDRCETCGLPSIECFDYGCTVMGADWYADDPPSRATPARVRKPLRLRVCLEPHDGPPWLSLLAQCAWLRGGIIGARVVP